MGLFLATVLGFTVGMAVIGYIIMHYFSMPMNNLDSSTIDPKPTEKF